MGEWGGKGVRDCGIKRNLLVFIRLQRFGMKQVYKGQITKLRSDEQLMLKMSILLPLLAFGTYEELALK